VDKTSRQRAKRLRCKSFVIPHVLDLPDICTVHLWLAARAGIQSRWCHCCVRWCWWWRFLLWWAWWTLRIGSVQLLTGSTFWLRCCFL